MITANVFRRVFWIRWNNAQGTAFTIDRDGRQYLVTARHVCEGIRDGAVISYHRHGQWSDASVRVVGLGASGRLEVDIAVLALEAQLSPSFPLEATSRGVVWGQEVYFLGYPYGLSTASAPNDGFPLALVKRALMSGSVGGNGDPTTFLLDGHNNPGFSGGPVVFRSANEPNDGYRVMGVVSGYQSENVAVTLNGRHTGLESRSNTGIIICPSIDSIQAMIEANPIGPPITF